MYKKVNAILFLPSGREYRGCCVVFKQQASSIHIGNQKYVKSKIIIMYTTVYVLFFTCY